MTHLNRRDFVGSTLASAALLAAGRAGAAPSLEAVYREVERRHTESIERLQAWIRQPSIAAENNGVEEGCKLTMQMLTDAGFQRAERIPTDGQPGIFATLDAGAKRTIGMYFMYDVKQADPSEWSSPPWEAKVVDLPNLGRAVMGRGAVKAGSRVSVIGTKLPGGELVAKEVQLAPDTDASMPPQVHVHVH